MQGDSVANVKKKPVFAKDRLLSVAQVAKRLTLSPSSVYNMINAGQILAIKVGAGKGLRIRQSVLEAFIYDREEALGGQD